LFSRRIEALPTRACDVLIVRNVDLSVERRRMESTLLAIPSSCASSPTANHFRQVEDRLYGQRIEIHR